MPEFEASAVEKLSSNMDNLWLVTATIMVLFMQAGFLMLEAGSVRSKNTINVAQKNIADFIVCGAIFLLVGAPLLLGAGSQGWFGWGGLDMTRTDVQLKVLFHFAFCATAATIVSGAVSERMRFHVYIALTVVISALIYPLFGHLVWGNALLTENPAFLSDLGFLDFAGSTVVHVIGGTAALVAVLMIGPREGRFDDNGQVKKIRGHSSVLSNFGTMVLMFGWLGFNAGGTTPGADNFSQILLNTIVAMVFGGSAGLIYSAWRTKGRSHPKTSTTGILGGVVAVTGACAYVDHNGAALIGLIGGLVAVGLGDILLHRFRIDDPVDAIAVHLGAGAIGTVLIAPLAAAEFITGGRIMQTVIQISGVAMAMAWCGVITFVVLRIINTRLSIRVSATEEKIGLNLAEHDTTIDLAQIDEIVAPVSTEPLGEMVNDNGSDTDGQIDLLSRVVDAARTSRDEVKTAEATIDILATRDQLTNLLNRTSFAAFINAQLKGPFALAFIDLDGFKKINDGFGHGIGDRVLIEIARRIDEIVPENAPIARFGGDEFVVALPYPQANGQTTRDWRDVCNDIVRTIPAAIDIDGNELFVGASIGVATARREHERLDEVIVRADMALYEAKARGKGCWVEFDPNMQERANRRTQLEIDMRAGIARNEFHAQFQPQVSMETGELLGFEALMRWDHPIHGKVGPDEFIPIAEQTGLIIEMGDRFVHAACKTAMQWPGIHGKRCRLSVNVSPIQLARSDVPAMLASALAQSGMQPSDLEIEVTETTLVENMTETKAVLEVISAMGVHIAIDDFGTGYSSLSYLQGFPINRLKVDRSFVEQLEHSDADKRIAKAIIDLGKSMGLVVIAEGVETEAQRACLAGLKCDELQGYLFSPPVSPLAAVTVIEKANTHTSGDFTTSLATQANAQTNVA